MRLGQVQAMKCHELLAALNEYVDGDRQSSLCEALQEHLAHCDQCQIVVDNIRQTIILYRAGRAVPLPAQLHERLCEVLRRRWTKFRPPGGVQQRPSV
jgi:predicted anti-sigma-YlaC factor YlaD